MSRSETGQAPARSADDRLDSWKEIAAHLDRDASTLRRWEKEGLPIHRERLKTKVAVYAYKSELHAWLRKRHPEAVREVVQATVAEPPTNADHLINAYTPPPSVFESVSNSPETEEVAIALPVTSAPVTRHPVPVTVRRQPGRGAQAKWVDRSVIVAVLLLLASVAISAYNRWRLSASAPPASRIESLAVLPFKDASVEVREEYFADGVAEMLIADLSQIKRLQVLSGAATTRYKAARKPLPQIARDLKVDAVVEAYVERSNGRVRLTARLFDTKNGTRVSGLTYERDLADLRSVSAAAARAIASRLQAEFTPAQHFRLARLSPVDPGAYEAYFKGHSQWKQLSCDGFTAAAQSFQQAVLAAPHYAPAHARLANTYFKLAEFGCEPKWAVIPRARASAARALSLDHTLAEAHAVLGMVSFLYDWDWQSAQTELKRATELNPSDAMARSWYGTFLFATGKHPDAFAQFKKARDIDPAPGITTLVYAYTLYHARRYDEAIGHFQRVLETYPNSVPAYFGMAACYERKRMRGKALKYYIQSKELSGMDPQTLAKLRSASWKGGLRAFWQKELELANSQARVDACWSAHSAAHVGDTTQTLSFLEKAYNARCSSLASLKVDPLYDKLRQEPRFRRIIQRMGLPDSKLPTRRRSASRAGPDKKNVSVSHAIHQERLAENWFAWDSSRDLLTQNAIPP